MGKGDIRTRRGKIWRGTTGVTRPRQKSKGIRPAAPSRKVKTLKELPKAVAEVIVKKPVAEALKHPVVETAIPVVEKVQPVIENIVAETPAIVDVPVINEKKFVDKKTKSPAKKVAKQAAKKAVSAKKAPAKKVTAKKKK